MRKKPKKYVCTDCGGDAFMAWETKKNEVKFCGGILRKGERICMSCGKKRGISFF